LFTLKIWIEEKNEKIKKSNFTREILFWPQLCYSPTCSHFPKPNLTWSIYYSLNLSAFISFVKDNTPVWNVLLLSCGLSPIFSLNFGFYFLYEAFSNLSILGGHSSLRIPEVLLLETSIWHSGHATLLLVISIKCPISLSP